MEKAKAYIKKNELRGGTLSATETPNYPPPSSSAPIHYPSSQQQYYHHYQQNLHNRSTSNPSAAHDNNEMPAVTSSSVCFVCGAKCPCRDRLRARPNPDKPNEPFFQFLERHEPPDDYQYLQPNQQYVICCVLCHTLLTNQWDMYEKEGKPYNERIYHFKRDDGKSYIGADMSTQGEYAAQMLGLSAEHITSNVPGHQWQQQQQQQHRSQVESHSRPTSRNDAPQQNRSLPQSGNVANNSVNNNSATNNNSSNNNNKSNSSHYQVHSSLSPHQQQQFHQQHLQQQQLLLQHQQQQQQQHQQQMQQQQQQHRSGISSFAQQKFKLGQIQQQQQQQQAQQSQPPKPPTPQFGDVLDLRNRTSIPLNPTPVTTPTPQGPTEVGILDLSMPDKNSSTEVCYVCGDEQRRGSLIELCTVVPLKDSADRDKPFFPIFNDNHPRPARSRPKDPRGMIQACRICYDHLMQQWNYYEAAKTQENERPYTIRKRPASVASSISSGGNATADRTTFVCYTCGVDSPSSQLHLVYCCSNAEREPYYPFIKDLEPFQNASPISPQGMVQICSSCLEKNSHRAEGGDPTTVNSSSNNLDALNNSNSNSSTIAYNSNHYHNNGSVSGQNTLPSGRYTPSDKSVSNLDAAGNVRFKPYESNSNSSSCHRSELKPFRRGDSRPNSPFGSTGGAGSGTGNAGTNGGSGIVENGQGQHTCYVCKAQCSTNKMEWLLTSAEHMNWHAMHFPCLKNQNDTSGTNRVLACKDCVSHLSKQWENMDNERIPLEKRRYNIPSPMSSCSPSDSRHLGSIKQSSSPSTTPSMTSSTPASQSQSIYCFLCGLHSEFLLARILYASKEGNRPYFPFLLKHKQHQNAEGLREDKTALVCTFCYHSLLNQWRKYESQPNPPSPSERTYNWHDYICHVCSVQTYRKRVRALLVNEYPNLKNHKRCEDALLLENAEYATVCLDCYESLRMQTSQYDRLGIPLARRQFNWIQQKPPPEDSPDVSVARMPCGERSDKVQISSAMRQLPNKKNNSSPKQFSNEKAKEVPPKPVQKRPTTSPAPMISSPHHLQSPSSGIPQQQPQPPPHVPLPAHALSNHVLPTTNHYPPSIQPSPQAANPPPGSAGSRQPQGTFASALRNLAKQVDSKDDEDRSGGRDRADVDRNSVSQNSHDSRIVDHRSSGGTTTAESERNAKKRSAPSPQPAEKVARLNSSTTASSTLQPELMARSGFQPYRSDDRLLHPAASFGLDYPSFLPPGVPGYMPGPAGYPSSSYFDPRLDLLRQHQHGHHALYPLPPHIYAMMSGAAPTALSHSHYTDRLKFEEEQRLRQEEERERSLREKEQREREARELREKEQREREKKEREMREREQKEKEAREREMREKEREKEMEAARKEHSRIAAMKFYAAQMYNSPISRSYQPIPPHVAAAYGVRAPPPSLQGLTFPSQGPMGLGLGLGVPGSLPPHLAGHPSFSSLAMSHPGLQLPPHLSPHYMTPSLSSAHSLSSQPPPHTSTSSMNLSTSAPTIVTSSPSLYYGHPHAMPPSSQHQQSQPISFAAHNHHSPNNNALKTTSAVSAGAYPTPTSTPNQNGGRTSTSPRVNPPPSANTMNEATTLDLTSSHSNQTPTPPVVTTGISNGVTTISDSSQSETSKDSISAIPTTNNKDDDKNSPPAPNDSDLKQQKSPGDNTGNKLLPPPTQQSVKKLKSPPPPPNPNPVETSTSATSENTVTSTLDASGRHSPPVVVSSSTSNDAPVVGSAAE